MKPLSSIFCIGPRQRLLRNLAEAHDMPQHIRRLVGAQVGELLGANECHASGERREQQRKLLADATGRHAGTVQRRAALQRRLTHRCRAALARVQPADGRHHVLAGPQQRGHLIGVRHQRRVDDRVSVQCDDLVDAVGRGDTQGFDADDLSDILTRLVRGVHPAADELEIGVFEHTLDGGDSDASRRPLHDPQAHSASSAVSLPSTLRAEVSPHVRRPN